jgi:hypothetical protein
LNANNLLSYIKENAEEVRTRDAIARVVGASEGKLNWDSELPKASWNCVTEFSGGFEVRLGAQGNHSCGFAFVEEVTIADLMLVFGPTITLLDVNYQDKCTGKSDPRRYYS